MLGVTMSDVKVVVRNTGVGMAHLGACAATAAVVLGLVNAIVQHIPLFTDKEQRKKFASISGILAGYEAAQFASQWVAQKISPNSISGDAAKSLLAVQSVVCLSTCFLSRNSNWRFLPIALGVAGGAFYFPNKGISVLIAGGSITGMFALSSLK